MSRRPSLLGTLLVFAVAASTGAAVGWASYTFTVSAVSAAGIGAGAVSPPMTPGPV